MMVFFVILWIDELLDLLLFFFQALLDLAHLFGEVIEYGFELVLENTLQTDHHSSETIIVNIAIVLSLFGLYRFIWSIPRLLRKLKRKFLAVYLKHRRRARFFWKSLPIKSKFKLVTTCFSGITFIFFVLTL